MVRRWRQHALAGVTIGACAMLAGCTKKAAKGEIMVALTSDMTPSIDVAQVSFDVKVNNGVILGHSGPFDLGPPTGSRLPATFAIVGNRAPDSGLADQEIVIRLSGTMVEKTASEPTRFLREAVVVVPANRIAVLQLPIEFLCVGSAFLQPSSTYVESKCSGENTCIGGACVIPDINTATLPNYDPALVYGGGAPEGGGQCFDTLGCFSADRGGVVVPPPPIAPVAGCGGTMASGGGGGGGGGGAGSGGSAAAGPIVCRLTPPGIDPTTIRNVALVSADAPASGNEPAKKKRGICYASGDCVVPLDEGTPGGWSYSAGGIALPAGVCCPQNWSTSKVIGIALTTACTTKRPGNPTCGDWSTAGKGTPGAKPPKK